MAALPVNASTRGIDAKVTSHWHRDELRYGRDHALNNAPQMHRTDDNAAQTTSGAEVLRGTD